MIYNKNFIWFHLPKTGGITTSSLLDYSDGFLPDLNNWKSSAPSGYPVTPKCLYQKSYSLYPFQHLTPNEVKQYFPSLNLETKDKILNFRKILPWIKSWNNSMTSLTQSDIVKQSLNGLIYSPESKSWHHPDEVLGAYLDDTEIKHFIRTEYLMEDFYKIFKNYGPIPLPRNTHKNVGHYDRLEELTFSEEQAKKIYESNPLWMSVENQIY